MLFIEHVKGPLNTIVQKADFNVQYFWFLKNNSRVILKYDALDNQDKFNS